MEEMSSQDRVFESAAELFAVLDTPVRLKIISAVCQQEKNVTELLALIDTTQPNMSQHLATLYRSGVLSKRRVGTQIYYRLQSERVAMLCRGGVFGSAGAPWRIDEFRTFLAGPAGRTLVVRPGLRRRSVGLAFALPHRCESDPCHQRRHRMTIAGICPLPGVRSSGTGALPVQIDSG